MPSRKGKNKKKRIWLRVLLSLIVILILVVGVFAFLTINNARSTVSNIQKSTNAIDQKEVQKKVENNEKLNVLLLGVDEREGDAGRSDALMVMSLDPDNDSMKIVSIPRDTRAEIVGNGTTEKINHAYARGGVDMSINTVENFLDIDLDYFVEMNMEGLSDLVDAVGGITVNSQLEFTQNGYSFTQGETSMDGKKAMAYVRMRKEDPNGDFGRNARQRQVIQAVIDKGASIKSVNKIDDLLDVLGNNVQTNIDFSTMTDLFQNYRNVRKNTENYQMQGTGTTIDGVYYYEIGQEERDKVHDMLGE
ncbi:cell envelope-related function transcriptional attenuator common domain-containing protein [Terribacillus halophilus]|uniref:Cell envelope-related function transcriptional attenuator common domain-containing protein n=1 Tax=Terribacillus halophilus TaxID=361279 RepID=A0A1G6ILK9_9BACI|nr:LCP family protein [Terribacillus halophilus]SDC07333.1 cell envelope-related function transcriptional attenuator common domain-containing protein [Terribacillus halophilus]